MGKKPPTLFAAPAPHATRSIYRSGGHMASDEPFIERCALDLLILCLNNGLGTRAACGTNHWIPFFQRALVGRKGSHALIISHRVLIVIAIAIVIRQVASKQVGNKGLVSQAFLAKYRLIGVRAHCRGWRRRKLVSIHRGIPHRPLIKIHNTPLSICMVPRLTRGAEPACTSA